MSFDRFLADLKQRAVAAGVSQQTLAETAPYLVYEQGIVNRDRGQRVFGQIFTEFAGRMAAPYRMQQGQQRIKTYAAARGEGIWRSARGDRGVLGTGERFRRQHGQSADAALAGVACV
jgi:membrane-bound lytic murein transglycosylase B